MKRSPLKRRPCKLRRVKLRPQSAKRRKQQPARRKCMAVVRERSEGRCELGITNCCTFAGVEGHELLPRSAGGSITDPSNVVLACRACHDFVTTHPAWAYSVGFLMRRAS